MSIAKRRKNRQRKSMADLQQTLRAWGLHPQWCGIDALKHVNQAFDMVILRLKMERELKEALVPRSLPRCSQHLGIDGGGDAPVSVFTFKDVQPDINIVSAH